MNSDDMTARDGSHVNGGKTVSLKLLDEADGDEEPPSRAVARGATAKTATGLHRIGSVESADAAFDVSPRSMAFCRKHFPDATVAQWNDWKWQLRNRLKDLKTLERVFRLSPTEMQAVQELGDALPVGITPYYASIMDTEDPLEPIRRTMIPVTNEFTRSPGEADDPLSEDHDMAVPGLVHRYPDRVLFLVTNFCATYCRYCTRARLVGKTGEYTSTSSSTRPRSSTSKRTRRCAMSCSRAGIR
jgi:lysine 2,3-aminomutase